MSDTRGVAETLAMDQGFFGNDDIAGKVYRDEPILTTAEQTEHFTPPKYREMRKMAGGGGYWERDAKIFYEQGKFMEDFEDDFNYQGEFARYFPTYQSMNDRQLRGYFSWRTRVRRGFVEKTSLSFAFVYIYELLNQIGVGSPIDGFYTLRKFWSAYGEIDARINPYLRLWMKDYVVYNDLDRDLFENFADTNFDRAVLTLLNHRSCDADAVFEALNSLSNYNLENSRFFKQHQDDVKNVVYSVFSRLSDHYDQKCKSGLCEKFFGKVHVNSYSMFKSAVFHRRTVREDFVYPINDIYQYRCENGNWSCERIFCDKGKIQQIGTLLKTVDFLMRRKYRFPSTLKVPQTTKLYQEIIDREIDKYRESARKRAMPEIVIDVSKLQDIRHVALEIQGKLIVEDAEDAGNAEAAEKMEALERPDALEASVDKVGEENIASLNEVEYRFMGCLLYGRPYDDLVRSRGLMLSVLIEAINEKLFDVFGDTVVVYDGDRPKLVGDYVGDLKEIISE